MNSDTFRPSDILEAELEVIETMPKWVYDLSKEAFAAEFASRVVFHPKIQGLTKGNTLLNDQIMMSIEEIVLKNGKFNQKNQSEVEK
jgi:hypothetical protein